MTTFADGLYQYGGVPVTPNIAALSGPPTGNLFFVGTGGNDNATGANGASPRAPFLTLAYALTKVTANNGDVIYLMPNQTITVSNATALALSVAGVTIIGLGVGNRRPLFDFTTANTATILVSAAGITVQNCRFRASFLSIAAAFTVAAGGYFTLIGNKFFDNTSVLNFLNIVQTTGIANTADGLTLIGNSWNGLGTTSVNSFVLSANDIDGAVWQSNYVLLARTATAAVFATITAGVLTNLICTGNSAISQQTADTGGGFINVGGTTSTGIVANNYLSDLSTTDLFMTTSVGVRFQQNFKTGVLASSGYLLPVADA